jgi:hypothetical protein
LQLALDLLGQQAIEELHGDRPEFAEALLQEQGALARIVGGMVALVNRRTLVWVPGTSGCRAISSRVIE